MGTVRLPLILAVVGMALLTGAGSPSWAVPAGGTVVASVPAAAPASAEVVASAPVSAASLRQGGAPRADTFPHLTHQGLFPLCTGCHEGIEGGDASAFYPESASCDGCHDGIEERRVDWTPSPRPVGLLEFSHPTHFQRVAQADEDPVDCASCHVAEEGPRLAVVPLEPARCLTCHEDDPDTHYTAPDCASCHRALAAVPGGDRLIADLPKPADHGDGGDAFLLAHLPRGEAGEARCATCHTQDRCVSCHVSGERPQIQAMPAAPPGWTLPAMEARYPIPEGHADAAFEVTHGRPAPNPADCSTCHTSNDCAACHVAPLPPSAQALPPRPQVRAPGVGLEPQQPTSHQTPFFMTAHTVLASAAPDACAGCHTQNYCTDCHTSQDAPGYHPQGFALRHAAAAGAQSMECSNCHNTAAFCLQCHVEVGFGGVGRLGPGYHDAEPLWLIRHGQGARQNLETCASCHSQRECLQCHSQTGAFKVSPHGPDFDPVQAQERNPWICSACHLGPPGGG